MAAGATYTQLTTITLDTALAQITFTSIPSTYTDLVLIIQTGVTASGNAGYCKINGDSASNYSTTYLTGNGSTAVGGRYSNSVYGIGFCKPGWGISANLRTTCIANINSYANTTTYKTIVSRSGTAGTATASGVSSEAGVGLWRSTAAINSITCYPEGSTTWLAGSTFSLYAIKAA